MPERQILSEISSPRDLDLLSPAELTQLAAELRAEITAAVSANGGHLSSNLGVVEITIALHRAFDFLRDRLVFDVGHQCYAHKLLTGRRDRFRTLRRKGGLTGFPNPAESPYDSFVVGHASTSISSAVGLAAAFRLRGEARNVVALVGDGAIGGGMCFEAMNHAGHAGENVLVALNDNDMAIAETVGALSAYLTELRSRPATRQLREDLHALLRRVPLVGDSLDALQEKLLDAVKGAVEPSHVFSAMGFRYFGPVDGHDIPLLEREFRHLARIPGPKLLHIVTRKGLGFAAAANDPETFHSAAPFEMRAGGVKPRGGGAEGYTDIFVRHLNRRARENPNVVALTAAMPTGTGIREFQKEFPERFIDVGICEAHSVTFAAALARAGMRPVLAIYSTFLQRGYDQLVHDVAVQGELPVVLALDRAGLVGADGPTHHGVFDIAFLRHIPGLTLMAPRDGEELRQMLDLALSLPGPAAIRYPRGAPPAGVFEPERAPLQQGRAETLRAGRDLTFFAYGRMAATALTAARLLEAQGVAAGVVNARFAKPLDRESLLAAAACGKIVTVEDHALACGFGSAVAEALADAGSACRLLCLGIPDRFVEHGEVGELEELLGLTPQAVADSALRFARG